MVDFENEDKLRNLLLKEASVIKDKAFIYYMENKKIQELVGKIKENKSKYYDPRIDETFESDFGTSDEEGEYYSDYSFDYRMYEDYRKIMDNYEHDLKELEDQKVMLQNKKFVFGKAKKIKELDEEIERRKGLYPSYIGIKQKEIASDKAKTENEEYETEIRKIYKKFIYNEVNKLLEEHPEYVDVKFSSYTDVEEIIKRCQKDIRAQFNSQKNVETNNKEDLHI